jgi:hypothetical protein
MITTITTTTDQDTRISNAFGAILNLGRPATGAEVKTALIGWLRKNVLDYEAQQAQTTIDQQRLTSEAGVVVNPFTPT